AQPVRCMFLNLRSNVNSNPAIGIHTTIECGTFTRKSIESTSCSLWRDRSPLQGKGQVAAFEQSCSGCSSECVVSLLLRFKTRSRSLTIHCSQAFPSVIFKTCKASPMPHIQQDRNICLHS